MAMDSGDRPLLVRRGTSVSCFFPRVGFPGTFTEQNRSRINQRTILTLPPRTAKWIGCLCDDKIKKSSLLVTLFQQPTPADGLRTYMISAFLSRQKGVRIFTFPVACKCNAVLKFPSTRASRKELANQSQAVQTLLSVLAP